MNEACLRPLYPTIIHSSLSYFIILFNQVTSLTINCFDLGISEDSYMLVVGRYPPPNQELQS